MNKNMKIMAGCAVGIVVILGGLAWLNGDSVVDKHCSGFPNQRLCTLTYSSGMEQIVACSRVNAWTDWTCATAGDKYWPEENESVD